MISSFLTYSVFISLSSEIEKKYLSKDKSNIKNIKFNPYSIVLHPNRKFYTEKNVF